MFVLGLAGEQFIAGLSMLNLNFWYSTYVVYGKQAGLANAANLGIMGAAIGIAVYAGVCWSAGDYPEDLAAERTDQKLGKFHSVLRD